MNKLTATESSDFTNVSPCIYKGDFDAHYTMSDIAARIASDLIYEEKWRRIAKNNEEYKKGNN